MDTSVDAAIRASEPPPAASSAHHPRQRHATTHSVGQPSARSRPEPRTAGRVDHARDVPTTPLAAGEHGEDGEDATLPAASMVASYLP